MHRNQFDVGNVLLEDSRCNRLPFRANKIHLRYICLVWGSDKFPVRIVKRGVTYVCIAVVNSPFREYGVVTRLRNFGLHRTPYEIHKQHKHS